MDALRINMQKKCFNILIWKSCFCRLEWSPNRIEYPAGWISCSENHGEQIHKMTIMFTDIHSVYCMFLTWSDEIMLLSEKSIAEVHVFDTVFEKFMYVSDLHWK